MIEAPLVRALTEIRADKEALVQDWITFMDCPSSMERSWAIASPLGRGSSPPDTLPQENYSKIFGQQALEDFLDALLEDIEDGIPDSWDHVTQREAVRLAGLGVSEDVFRIVLGSLAEVLWAYSLKKWVDYPDCALSFLREADTHLIRGRTEMADVFLKRRVELIKKQQEAIIELSTPVIPLMENILIVPLIGTIDTARANQIMENILYGIKEQHAEIVIIDITGVHLVDSTVAQHLIKAYQASGLLGAKSILVGMRPEVAQTIVQLNIAFDEVVTRNTLAQGIEYALNLQKKKIVSAPVDGVDFNGN